MASAITHFVVGASIGLPAVVPERGWWIPITCGLFGAAPDLDMYAMFAFDIPRGSIFSHRGFFHSPFFLALAAFTIAWLVMKKRGWIALGALWTCAAVTHPLLDMLTDGGSGVMLLYPFSTERLFFPWRPIRVSPLGIARFFERAGEILFSEFPFNLAAVAAGLAILFARSRRTAASPDS